MASTDKSRQPIRVFFNWLWDWVIEHYPQLIYVGGAVAMTYLTKISGAVSTYGPIAWGVIGLSTYALLILIYAVYGLTKKNIASANLAEARSHANGVNPLDDFFSKKRISLSDFFNPFYQSIKAAKFQDCELLGPANIVLLGHSSMMNSRLINCQMVIIKDGAFVKGVTAFESCQFDRCKIFEVTIYATKDQYLDMKSQLNGMQMDVISDGNTGSL